VDELAVAAPQVEHGVRGPNPAAEKTARQNLPDPVAVGRGANEAAVIDLGEFLRVGGHAAGKSGRGRELEPAGVGLRVNGDLFEDGGGGRRRLPTPNSRGLGGVQDDGSSW